MYELTLPTLALILGLFIILSPGLILTLPGRSQSEAVNIGVGYLDGSAATFCSTSPDTFTEPECAKATSAWTSGYTWVGSVVVHALIFMAILQWIPIIANWFGIEMKMVPFFYLVFLGLLFVALSPGVLLTLPPLTAGQCGEGTLNIMDNPPTSPANPKFCAGATDGFAPGTSFTSDYPNCRRCTSVWLSQSTTWISIVVHSIVYVLLAWLVGRYLFFPNRAVSA